LFVGDRSILLIFPNIRIELYCRSWFFTYNIFAIFTVFFRQLFPEEYKKLYTRIVVGFYALVTLDIMLVPVPVFLGHIIYVDIISFAVMITDVALVILAVKRKRQFALLVLFGVSLPFILGINDLLFAMDIIITGYYAPLGYIGYVVCQSIYISQRYAETFRRVEDLSRQLEQNNIELEAKVEQRTQEIMLANAQLKQLNMTKDKFLTIMAHDLKSPLNAAMGFSELLAMEYDDLDDEERKAYSRNILAASSNTFKLLENLLDWSRLQMGRSDYAPVLHDVSASINEALLLHSSQAEEKHIFLRSDVPYGTFVFADEHMIKTVLRNLVSNALKFTDSGGLVRISKAIGESESPNTVTLMVQDTGVGMSTADIASLFHIDTKLRKPGTANEQGTGLGLLICKEYMEKNGGGIRVESSLGIGTTFYIVIPSVEPAV
jgi:signal transduction histidine kinase